MEHRLNFPFHSHLLKVFHTLTEMIIICLQILTCGREADKILLQTGVALR